MESRAMSVGTKHYVPQLSRILTRSLPFSYDVPHITVENQFEVLSHLISPLRHLPYSEQLEWKFNINQRQLHYLSKKLQSAFRAKVLNENDCVCDLEPIRPSPVITQYRNKNDLGVSEGLDGNPKTVGLFLSAMRQRTETDVFKELTRKDKKKRKTVFSIPIDDLTLSEPSFSQLGKVYQDHMANSPLRRCGPIMWHPAYAFKERGYAGNFRNLIIRNNQAGEFMATVLFHPQQLTETEIETEKQGLRTAFEYGAKSLNINLKSLFFQRCKFFRCNSLEADLELLLGERSLEESLLGLQFRISPLTFFQQNTKAAEVLLHTIAEVSELDQSTTLLDFCCGSGVYSVALSRHVRQCIGIDIEASAVEDARHNARINGADNARFVCGRVEDEMARALESVSGSAEEKLVAIVNPSRYGMMNNGIMLLRNFERLKTIVFVSCHPYGKCLENLFNLARPPLAEDYTGTPFKINRVIPIDLFPQTVHSELVFLLQR